MDFIKHYDISKETYIYKSKINFENLFNNLEDDIKQMILSLTEYYSIFLIEKLETYDTASINIHHIKKIKNMDIKIYLYIQKNFIINSINTVKIGLNFSLPSYEHVNCKNYDMFQSISFVDCDLNKQDEFKKYIYNTLAYTYIIIENFTYHPMLKYLQYYEDVEELVNITKYHIELFGEKTECCICLEQTITNTICNHGLCQRCFSLLNEKICPLCRKKLVEDDNYTYIYTQTIDYIT
jgi:hypothetical protein